jgi:hypothetical protein
MLQCAINQRHSMLMHHHQAMHLLAAVDLRQATTAGVTIMPPSQQQ